MIYQRHNHGLAVHHQSYETSLRHSSAITVTSIVIMLMVVVFSGLCMLPQALAADGDQDSNSSSANNSSIVIGDNIIDSENLLGSNLNRVNDSITQVQQQTGVRLQLMYIPSFSDNGKPQQWAERYLTNTGAPRNTVFMAVASQDGNVVVVVSKGSDTWLSNTDTVNRLSDAALQPLTQETPDWSGAAIALANAIISEKHPSVGQWISRHTRLVWTIVGIVIVVLLIVGVILFKVFYKTPAQRQLERRRRRNAQRAKRNKVASADVTEDSSTSEK